MSVKTGWKVSTLRTHIPRGEKSSSAALMTKRNAVMPTQYNGKIVYFSGSTIGLPFGPREFSLCIANQRHVHLKRRGPCREDESSREEPRRELQLQRGQRRPGQLRQGQPLRLHHGRHPDNNIRRRLLGHGQCFSTVPPYVSQ